MAHVEQQQVDDKQHGGRRLDVVVHLSGHEVQSFPIGSDARLLDVMDKAAKLAGVGLLPPRQRPFDELHSMNGEHVGAIIENLDQSLAEYLHHDGGHNAHFTIELARAIRVNTRWDVAPKEKMTPLEILALPKIHLDPAKFTLYLPEHSDFLPPEIPIHLKRGMDLEAQSDGKYGGGC